MSTAIFGVFFQNVCLELAMKHQWKEHANALIYTQGGPFLMECIYLSYEDGKSIEETALLVHKKHLGEK